MNKEDEVIDDYLTRVTPEVDLDCLIKEEINDAIMELYYEHDITRIDVTNEYQLLDFLIENFYTLSEGDTESDAYYRYVRLLYVRAVYASLK